MFRLNLDTGSGLTCYYCGHESEEGCSSESVGEEVKCQMTDPAQHHYGDACYVGHSGRI